MVAIEAVVSEITEEGELFTVEVMDSLVQYSINLPVPVERMSAAIINKTVIVLRGSIYIYIYIVAQITLRAFS